MLKGILSSVASSLLGGGSQQNQAIPQLLQSLLSSQGGVEGLVGKLQQNGLGDMVSSWIGTGENQEVSSEQLAEAIGQDELRNVAQQAGVDENEVPNLLSQYLPKVVDKLSPNGELDTNNLDIESLAKSALGSLFK
ncbi:YidB family protein [Pasteurella skyensis]|uniref:YidB family protein n=1 Tax=Phocoenobacter skyensis TaxID=97481 RepID=A0AAJ6P160_9PAST|nr:YidB family protein [Pasteurella skyensis]MDP8161568.1 YidB family protein [Pasteurella skyensis]MDP8173402.1 YidB family protein [Pasteurella skyensis]MDP8175962.1 YidB family protein [Pasteurella skyensis]MDP8177930.1 YidB family protein [Pasteurella skyensis]MDP8182411.1 YidB family protein [Pasteurella skyensis]